MNFNQNLDQSKSTIVHDIKEYLVTHYKAVCSKLERAGVDLNFSAGGTRRICFDENFYNVRLVSEQKTKPSAEGGPETTVTCYVQVNNEIVDTTSILSKTVSMIEEVNIKDTISIMFTPDMKFCSVHGDKLPLDTGVLVTKPSADYKAYYSKNWLLYVFEDSRIFVIITAGLESIEPGKCYEIEDVSSAKFRVIILTDNGYYVYIMSNSFLEISNEDNSVVLTITCPFYDPGNTVLSFISMRISNFPELVKLLGAKNTKLPPIERVVPYIAEMYVGYLAHSGLFSNSPDTSFADIVRAIDDLYTFLNSKFISAITTLDKEHHRIFSVNVRGRKKDEPFLKTNSKLNIDGSEIDIVWERTVERIKEHNRKRARKKIKYEIKASCSDFSITMSKMLHSGREEMYFPFESWYVDLTLTSGRHKSYTLGGRIVLKHDTDDCSLQNSNSKFNTDNFNEATISEKSLYYHYTDSERGIKVMIGEMGVSVVCINYPALRFDIDYIGSQKSASSKFEYLIRYSNDSSWDSVDFVLDYNDSASTVEERWKVQDIYVYKDKENAIDEAVGKMLNFIALYGAPDGKDSDDSTCNGVYEL